ncbi:MAG: arsenate reductase ArsC [Anaerolineales bacterium]|nr:arsenate reductase ArsC [Anaerolineales bacterium]
MAEAIVNARLSDRWRAFSAGTRPTGYVNPKAIAVLNEIGIDHQGRSKGTSYFSGDDFDLIVTVCDSATEDCPVWLRSDPQVQMAFEDPAAFKGNEQEVLNKFRQVRDEISIQIPGLLARYE